MSTIVNASGLYPVLTAHRESETRGIRSAQPLAGPADWSLDWKNRDREKRLLTATHSGTITVKDFSIQAPPGRQQPDTITTLGGSLIQIGPLNDRVYLMKLDARDLPGIVDELQGLARSRGLTKICAKVPIQAGSHFLSRGFVLEARVPDLFWGREDGLFLARFLEEWRSRPDRSAWRPTSRHNDTSGPGDVTSRSSNAPVIKMGLDRVQAMAETFKNSFSAYPFPIDDPVYLTESLRANVSFFGIEIQGWIAALASSEMNMEAGHVEMTDFITLPAYRGQGLATALLRAMEQDMRGLGFRTAFSIARAGSAGMNATFARQGYAHTGRLTRNTCFNGFLEDMNVWAKRLG